MFDVKVPWNPKEAADLDTKSMGIISEKKHKMFNFNSFLCMTLSRVLEVKELLHLLAIKNYSA